MVFHGISNTLFLIKVLAFLNLASLGIDWLNGIVLVSCSALWAAGSWCGLLAAALPATPAGAGVVAFLLWPSVMFWAAGVTKESCWWAAAPGCWPWCWMRLYGAAAARRPRPLGPGRLVAGAWLLALLHFKMRYFFAVPLLGGAGGRWRWCDGCSSWAGPAPLGAGRCCWLAVLGGGRCGWRRRSAWLFGVNKFTNQVMHVYTQHLEASVGPAAFRIPRPACPPLESVAAPRAAGSRQCPDAAVAGRVARAAVRGSAGSKMRPAGCCWPWPLLALLAGRERASCRLRWCWCWLSTAWCWPPCMGLTTPNLGSLHRYRSGLLPYLLLLLLQNDYAAGCCAGWGWAMEPSRPASLRR